MSTPREKYLVVCPNALCGWKGERTQRALFKPCPRCFSTITLSDVKDDLDAPGGRRQ